MNPLFKYHDENVPIHILRRLHLLEEANKRPYPTVNSNYLTMINDHFDLVGCYTAELMELRDLAFKAYELCLNLNSLNSPLAKKSPARILVRNILKFVLAQPWLDSPSNPVPAPTPPEPDDPSFL